MFLIYQANKTIANTKGKSQLFRRKSELPHDITTFTALDKHKRNQEYLTTTPDQQAQPTN